MEVLSVLDLNYFFDVSEFIVNFHLDWNRSVWIFVITNFFNFINNDLQLTVTHFNNCSRNSVKALELGLTNCMFV